MDSINSGKLLKAKTGWLVNSGNDSFGFRALPAGSHSAQFEYMDAGKNGLWWSASENGNGLGLKRYTDYTTNDMATYFNNKYDGFSIRCVKDENQTNAIDSIFNQDANTVGLWTMKEGSGNQIKNAVTGSLAILNGGVSWIDGTFGKAIKFDGISGSIDLNFNPPEENVTYEMIVSITSDTGWLFSLWGGYNSGIALTSNGVIIPEFSNNSGNISWPQNNIYIAFTIDSNHKGTVYANGQLVDSSIATHAYSWASTILGSYTGSSGFANCTFERFKISSVVRTESEIKMRSEQIGLTGTVVIK